MTDISLSDITNMTDQRYIGLSWTRRSPNGATLRGRRQVAAEPPAGFLACGDHCFLGERGAGAVHARPGDRFSHRADWLRSPTESCGPYSVSTNDEPSGLTTYLNV